MLPNQDPETIRKAGNDLFNINNIEGAIEKYKEAIAAGDIMGAGDYPTPSTDHPPTYILPTNHQLIATNLHHP